jgi:hypothetical protein
MTKRRPQTVPGLRGRVLFDFVDGALRDHFSAVHSRTWAEIDDVIGLAHRFLVVLDDD